MYYDGELGKVEYACLDGKINLSCISNVLPDLGVDYVRQETFEDFGKNFIRENIEIESGNYNLQNIIEKKLSSHRGTEK